ncbi:MAG: hypothetical protein IJV07_03565 [Alphaproteobacteria bacterium]|nr:hypothetical protein [Alphaproteobacteria bacterium]
MEITPIVSTLTTAASAYFMKESVDTQKKAMKAERAANQRQYDLEVAQKKLTLAEEQRKNRNLLAQQQSGYRAKLGAAGLSAQSGSGRAVLDSMKQEYDTEDKYLINQANISLEALLNGINTKQNRNLLSMSSLNNRQMSNTLNAINNFTSNAGRSVLK